MRLGEWVSALALVAGCGTTSAGLDAGTGASDSGVGTDGGVVVVDAGTTRDAEGPVDAAPPSDAARTPEVCTGGLDEDGDTWIDCDDDGCWEESSCAAQHVAGTAPGLVACGEPIERSAVESDEDCARVGMPEGSEHPTECATEVDLESTVRFFCDAAGAVAAAWVLERLTLPRSSRMISERIYEVEDYEHVGVIDWERTASGPGWSTGMGPSPTHESYGESTWIVTVRAVAPGDAIDRLNGLAYVTTIIDLDAPMSTSTRRTFRTGATSFVVPR
ncbi:MAG: hypothetical protein M3Y87_25665 [Myxococcota bacterium]|nr:hypothetical protein [Myxococcota bacterium]